MGGFVLVDAGEGPRCAEKFDGSGSLAVVSVGRRGVDSEIEGQEFFERLGELYLETVGEGVRVQVQEAKIRKHP